MAKNIANYVTLPFHSEEYKRKFLEMIFDFYEMLAHDIKAAINSEIVELTLLYKRIHDGRMRVLKPVMPILCNTLDGTGIDYSIELSGAYGAGHVIGARNYNIYDSWKDFKVFSDNRENPQSLRSFIISDPIHIPSMNNIGRLLQRDTTTENFSSCIIPANKILFNIIPIVLTVDNINRIIRRIIGSDILDFKEFLPIGRLTAMEALGMRIGDSVHQGNEPSVLKAIYRQLMMILCSYFPKIHDHNVYWKICKTISPDFDSELPTHISVTEALEEIEDIDVELPPRFCVVTTSRDMQSLTVSNGTVFGNVNGTSVMGDMIWDSIEDARYEIRMASDLTAQDIASLIHLKDDRTITLALPTESIMSILHDNDSIKRVRLLDHTGDTKMLLNINGENVIAFTDCSNNPTAIYGVTLHDVNNARRVYKIDTDTDSASYKIDTEYPLHLQHGGDL